MRCYLAGSGGSARLTCRRSSPNACNFCLPVENLIATVGYFLATAPCRGVPGQRILFRCRKRGEAAGAPCYQPALADFQVGAIVTSSPFVASGHAQRTICRCGLCTRFGLYRSPRQLRHVLRARNRLLEPIHGKLSGPQRPPSPRVE
jgi:hypothetical protein